MTGANLPAMKLALEDEYQRLGTSTRQSARHGNAQVLGYRLVAYDPTVGNATVDVVVTSPDLAGQDISFRVSLVWAQDDWGVLAPPSGSWGTVATTLGVPPAGLLDYRELRRPAASRARGVGQRRDVRRSAAAALAAASASPYPWRKVW
jgi:hypothetical protein